MQRVTKALSAAALLAVTAMHAGCGSSASGLTPGAQLADTPTVTNEDPMARPIQVAWTAARAERCGFYFDPAKLRASYMSYESAHGAAGEQLAKIQASYDTTFKTISGRVSSNPDYCSDKKSTEIKADLQRHLAGDYAPNLPKPKAADPCGVFGCAGSSAPEEKFSAKKMYDDLDRKAMR